MRAPRRSGDALITACLIVVAIMCAVATAGIVLLPPHP